MEQSPPDSEHAEWLQGVEDALRRRGVRLTKQRRAIAESFLRSEGHVNADELYASVKASNPSIGQATVYRTLRLLQDAGLASSSTFGSGAARFEVMDGHHHDHLICTRCGRIVEFVNEAIETLQDEVAAQHGFRLTHHRMELYGVPEVCIGGECAFP